MKDLRPLVATCLVALLASTSSAQNWFDAGALPTEPSEGETFGVGDFEGDGDVDLWFVEGSVNAWTAQRVLLNDGLGSFTPGPVTRLPAATGHVPLAAPLVDVTGDGLADVCFARYPSGGGHALVVLPGAPGGAFGAPLSFPVPAGIEGLAFGDNDADGVLELATLHDKSLLFGADHVVRWWDWSGTTFVPSAEVLLPAGSLGAGGASAMAAIDWDGDGRDDLVVGESVGSYLLVLPSVAGAPTLGTSVMLTSGSHVLPVVGDLDGDGDVDVLCVSTQTPMHTIPLLRTGPGAFVQGPVSELPFSTTFLGKPRWLADWDSDGDLDLISSRRATSSELPGVSLIENDGLVFAKVAELYSGAKLEDFGDGGGPADFDGDGHPDFAARNAVLFGSGRLEDGLGELLGPGTSTSAMVAFDRDGDGDLDLALRAAGGSVFVGSGVRTNDGSGNLSSVSIPPAPAPAGWGELRALGDFDGQGGADLLVTTTKAPNPFQPPQFLEQRIWLDDHLGGYVDGGVVAAGEIGAGAADFLPVVDVDGDGDLDVLDTIGGAGGYWQNDGTGAFVAMPLFPASPIVAFDLEGDGDLDYVAHTSGPSQLLLMRDDGPAFTAVALASSLTGGFDPDAVVLSDLDGDGLDDLVVGGVYVAPNQQVQLWRNTGSGFALAASLLGEASCDERAAHFDVDGDGVLDLVFSRGPDAFASDRMLVFRGQGGGFAFDPLRRFVGVELAGFADLDGDGDPDGLGARRVTLRRFDGPGDGLVRQYGLGSAGTGGVVPLLGAAGPLRVGSATAELRLRQGVGGSVGLLVVGGSEAALADFAGLGVTLLAGPPLSVIALPLGGIPGTPGVGSFDLLLTGLLPGLVGQQLFLQLGVLDAGTTFGVATSNGLDLTFGL